MTAWRHREIARRQSRHAAPYGGVCRQREVAWRPAGNAALGSRRESGGWCRAFTPFGCDETAIFEQAADTVRRGDGQRVELDACERDALSLSREVHGRTVIPRHAPRCCKEFT